MFLKGIASGNLVEIHIIVSKSSLPDFDSGKGATKSNENSTERLFKSSNS